MGSLPVHQWGGGMTVRETWGMACPSCGSDESISVEVSVIMNLSSDGTSDTGGDHVWGDDNFCLCGACRFEGVVCNFRIKQKDTPT